MDNQNVTKWWFGIGPSEKTGAAIVAIQESGWQVQVAADIGQYATQPQATLIAARISCAADTKAPFPHPGNEFEPVFIAEN